MEDLKQHIEALIFTSEQSITKSEIVVCLQTIFEEDFSDEVVQSVLDMIKNQYQNELYAYELAESAGGYQFLTKPRYQGTVGVLLQQRSKKKLSTAAMETLAIIAYKQPITKAEIEHIRGVSSDYSVQKLLEKDLIEISGKSEGPGKPVLYKTSKSFMDYFGINSVKDLPQLKDVYIEQNVIGSQVE